MKRALLLFAQQSALTHAAWHARERQPAPQDSGASFQGGLCDLHVAFGAVRRRHDSVDGNTCAGFMLNMASGLRFDDMTEQCREERRWRSRRPLLVCFALSLALHLALLVALPEPAHDDLRAVTRVLDVVLQRDEPPPLPAPAALPQPAPRDDSAATKRLPPAVRDTQKTQSVRAALPAPPGAAAGETPAAPERERPVAAAVADRSEGVAAAVPSKNEPPAAAREAAISPPSFNAAYLRNPPPRYPLIARRNGEQGTVTLKVLVARDGTPASVTVEKSSGSSHLDAAALEAVGAWRFVPARRGAQPVEAWVLVPIVFRLEGAS
ncbi:MAG: energy transducer TonB [Burkholderiales bacterium]